MRSRAVLLGVLLLFCAVRGYGVPGDEHWDDRFTNAILCAGTVSQLAWERGELYVTGEFHTAGNVAATNIAKWNGTNWTALGSGLSRPPERLAVGGSNVYVSGFGILPELNFAYGLARWNGKAWTLLDTSLRSITAMTAQTGAVFVAGPHSSGSGVECITETDRRLIGLSSEAGSFSSLMIYKGHLYTAGSFTSINGVPVTNLAVWNGSRWAPLRHGVARAGRLRELSLAADNRWLYVAGVFNSIGQRAITNIARWDGTNWYEMPGLHFTAGTGIYRVSARRGNVYVAGLFGPDKPRRGLNFARWNEDHGWTIIPTGPQIYPCVAATDTGVFLGGDFTRLANTRADGIGFWTGTRWRPVGGGVTGQGQVNALAERRGDVIVGGRFNSIGGITASNLARWDGTNWYPFGPGTDGPVNALAGTKTGLYTAGNFSRLGNAPSAGVARLKGTNWSSLGIKLNLLSAQWLGVFGTNVFIGGLVRDSLPGNYGICRWNGAEWLLEASAETGLRIEYIAGFFQIGSEFYVAGLFRYQPIGGGWTFPSGYDQLVQWDGRGWGLRSWNADGFPLSVTVHNGVLYAAGGPFSIVPSLLIFTIWDGSDSWRSFMTWFPKGGVIGGPMASLRDNIVVGNQIGENLLRWDGVDWHALGSGVRGSLAIGIGNAVRALLPMGTNLIVGGKIDRAGGKPSHGIAIWHDPPVEKKLRIKREGSDTLVYWPREMTNYVLEATSDLTARTWTAIPQAPTLFGSHYVVTNALSSQAAAPAFLPTNAFFRLRFAKP